MGDGAGEDTEEFDDPPLFCNSCFRRTFCESSDFVADPADDMAENLHPALLLLLLLLPLPVVSGLDVELTLVSSDALSTGSLLTTLVASRLRRLLNICDAVSRPCTCAGASSVDFERRNEAAFCSWFCSSVVMEDGMWPLLLISGCDSVALSILATGVAVVEVTLMLVIVAARDVLITIDLV